MSQVSNRYSKANNQYMGEAYNPDEEDKNLMYFDINNVGIFLSIILIIIIILILIVIIFSFMDVL